MEKLIKYVLEYKINPVDLKVLFLLFQKYTIKEIAEMLGCSQTRIRQRESRGLHVLKAFLIKQGEL
jgi:DNA-directed RNA polymerase specialized sigma subunit